MLIQLLHSVELQAKFSVGLAGRLPLYDCDCDMCFLQLAGAQFNPLGGEAPLETLARIVRLLASSAA